MYQKRGCESYFLSYFSATNFCLFSQINHVFTVVIIILSIFININCKRYFGFLIKRGILIIQRDQFEMWASCEGINRWIAYFIAQDFHTYQSLLAKKLKINTYFVELTIVVKMYPPGTGNGFVFFSSSCSYPVAIPKTLCLNQNIRN